MKRRGKILLSLCAVGVLAIPGSYLVEVYSADLTLGEVFSDFGYSGSTMLTWGRDRVVVATPEEFAAALPRLERSRSGEARSAAAWRITHMGEAAIPFLVADLDRPYESKRTRFVLRRLGELRARAAVPRLVKWFHEPVDFWHAQLLLECLRDIGDAGALKVLIEQFRKPRNWDHEKRNEMHWNLVASAIAAIGGAGTTVLLDDLDVVEKTRALRLFGALEKSRDPRAALHIITWYSHPDMAIRDAVRLALDRMGSAAVPALCDRFRGATNPFERSVLVRQIGRQPGEDAARFLAGHVTDRVLAPHVVGLLAENATPPAIDALHRIVGRHMGGGVDAVSALQAAGPRARLPVIRALGSCLDHPSPVVRDEVVRALWMLEFPEAIPLLESAITDPDPRIARDAEYALRSARRAQNVASFAAVLPAWTYGGLKPLVKNLTDAKGWGGFARFCHCVAVLCSALLGLAILIGRARAFDAWSFRLLIQVLLLEGFAGDLLWMSRNPIEFHFVIGVHLLLLIGLVSLEGERRPGAIASRFHRLGGAALWIVAPGLLFVATPRVAEALWVATESFAVLPTLVGVAIVAGLLLAERMVLGRPLLVVSRLGRRVLGSLISMMILAVLGRVLFEQAFRAWYAGDPDEAAILGFLLAPLVVVFLFELVRAVRPEPAPAALPPPPDPERIEVDTDGNWTTIRFARLRAWPALIALAYRLPFFLGAAALLESGDLNSGGFGAFALVLGVGLLGCAATLLAVTLITGQQQIQVVGGYVRGALTLFGGCVSGGAWRRGLGSSLNIDLEPAERLWLRGVMATAKQRAELAHRADLARGADLAGTAEVAR